MADYLKGKKYVSYGGKDYLDKLYESANIENKTGKKRVSEEERKNYPFRCYCTQTFRYLYELKQHRKESGHIVRTRIVPE